MEVSPGKSTAAEVSPPVFFVFFYVYNPVRIGLFTGLCRVPQNPCVVECDPPLQSLIKALLGRGWSRSPAGTNPLLLDIRKMGRPRHGDRRL